MSRIHEALKKAEEQRAASPAQVGQTKPASAPPVIPANISVLTSSPSRNASVTTPPLTLDVLRECSPQSHWSPDAKTMLFFGPDEQTYGTEQFRALRSRLYQAREKQPLKKILVTSALAKEGKSFVAANLAQALVQQEGRRVLLIYGDLRGARLHLALGTAIAPGLADYLLGTADELTIMQRGAKENLFFIPSGHEVSNPAELIAGERLKALLNRLEPLFDWIIIDSPPAVPVTDAALLAKHCDGVLMVVRANATPFDVAQKAREEFGEDQLLGVVLNGVGPGSLPYTRYYYTYDRTNGKEAQR